MMPTKEEKEEMKQRKMTKKGADDDSENGSHVDTFYEMHSSKTQQDHQNQVPFTPRTQAFHALDRRLPLRGQ